VTKGHVWHNTVDRLDVDGDGRVAAADPLAVINFLNGFGPHHVPTDGRSGGPYVEVNGDSIVAPSDALDVINAINADGPNAEVETMTSDVDLFTLLALDLASNPKRRSIR
jgi:hypothetical protein